MMKKIKLGCLALGLGTPLLLLLIILGFAAFNGRTGAETDFSQSVALAQPPPPLAEPRTLRLVTFNIACAYGFTTNRPERLRAIAEIITGLDPDIVGFQEAFIAADREILLDALQGSRLRHHVRYPSATTGNGLFTVSAWPIEEAYFHRFDQSGPWYRIWEGDWWAGKGVGLARIRLPEGTLVDFYNTHAQAGRRHPTRYLEVRTSQMEGLAQFVNATKNGAGPAFVVGDFNTVPGRADFEAAVQGAHLERIMTIDSGIDHLLAVSDGVYHFETLETLAIEGEVMGSKGNLFLSRAPTFREMRRLYFGPGEMTRLSDHEGFLSEVRVIPRTTP
jgi:sphingomyelin phosphodiesterase 2